MGCCLLLWFCQMPKISKRWSSDFWNSLSVASFLVTIAVSKNQARKLPAVFQRAGYWIRTLFFFYCLSFALLCSMNGNFHSASVVKWASNSGHLAFTFEFFITQLWFIVLDLHPPQPFLFSRILFVSYSLFWKSFHCNFLYNVCNSESHFAIILVEKFDLYGKLQVLGACVTW